MPSPPPTLPPIRALGIDLPPLHSDYSNLLQQPSSSIHDAANHELFAAVINMADTAPVVVTNAPPPVRPPTNGEGEDDDDESYDEDRDHEDDGTSEDSDEGEYTERDPYPWQPLEQDTNLPCDDELAFIDSKTEHSASEHEYWTKKTFFDIADPDVRPLEQGRIDWTVTGFNGTKEKPNAQLIMRSPVVKIGGYDWQIKFYPKGDRTEYLSIYIECVTMNKPDWTGTVDLEHPPLPVLSGSPRLQYRRSVAAQIGMVMYNPAEPRTNVYQRDANQYQQGSADYGWKYFTEEPRHAFHYRKHGQRRPIYENDTLAFTAYIRLVDDPTMCMWNDSITLSNPLTSPTTLFPWEGISARVAAATVLFHYPPFRKWLYGAANPSPRLITLQGMLDKFLARKLRRKHLRHQGIPSGHDVVAILHGLRNVFEKEEETTLLQDLENNVLGSLSPEHVPICHNRLPTGQRSSIKEALKSVHPQTTPPLLFIELERQRFDESTRKWTMIRNAVKLDDKISYGGVEYQLFAFINHVGKLSSGDYSPYVRPGGPGSMWYGYHGSDVTSLTQKTAMDLAMGKLSWNDKNAARQSSGKSIEESIAYLAMYVRKDQTLEAFSAPVEEVYHSSKTPAPDTDSIVDRGFSQEDITSASGLKPQAVVNVQPPRRPPPLPQTSDPMDGDDVIMSDAEDNLPVQTFISHAVPAKTKDETVTKTINYFAGPHYVGGVLAQDGKYHGEGKLISTTGDVYSGAFKHGKFHGQGNMIYTSSGDKYNGEWKDGQHHGHGTLIEKESGNIFEGGWRDGRKHGSFTLQGQVTEDDKQYCQICYEREMNTAFYDCGHVLACKQCASAVHSCPVCRKQVIGRLELFGVRVSMQ